MPLTRTSVPRVPCLPRPEAPGAAARAVAGGSGGDGEAPPDQSVVGAIWRHGHTRATGAPVRWSGGRRRAPSQAAGHAFSY